MKRDWVSVDKARLDYGVVIAFEQNNLPIVDINETNKLRDTMRASETPNQSFYNLCDARMEYEKVWTKTNYDVLTKCLS